MPTVVEILIRKHHPHRHYCPDCNKTKNCERRGCEDIPTRVCHACRERRKQSDE